MKCKECGFETDLHPRFCPECGSYFIDADSETESVQWMGVMTANGDVIQKHRSHASGSGGKNIAQESGWRKTVGIIAVVFSLICFLSSLAYRMGELEVFAVMGIFLFIPAFVLSIITGKNSYRSISWIALIITLVITVWS